MTEIDKKLKEEWQYWEDSYQRLIGDREQRVCWLESEVAYIQGKIHRATKYKPNIESKVLQIGAGPVDVIHFWNSNYKFAIDPLADKYKEKFSEYQDEKLNYISGVGEDMPYEDNYFDIVIIRNALDHVYDPVKTLREIHRVLKPNGVVYIWIYLYVVRASLAYRFINSLTKMYETEPWAFTWRRVNRLVQKQGFKLLNPAIEHNIFNIYNLYNPYKEQCGTESRGVLLRRFLLDKILNWYHDRAYSCVALAVK